MINLYNMDCMEFMVTLPDKAYDLAIVDPPYGCGDISEFTPRAKGTTRNKIHKETTWNIAPTGEYFKELFRVSQNQIIWGVNYFDVHIPISRGWIVWDKLYENTNNFSACELAWTSFDRILKMIRLSQRWIPNTPLNIHPTQKPVALYKWLLTNYAKKGDKILDTHGGSMSSAIACHDLGFDLDLCEIDKDYFEDGKARLERHQKQQMINFGE